MSLPALDAGFYTILLHIFHMSFRPGAVALNSFTFNDVVEYVGVF